MTLSYILHISDGKIRKIWEVLEDKNYEVHLFRRLKSLNEINKLVKSQKSSKVHSKVDHNHISFVSIR